MHRSASKFARIIFCYAIALLAVSLSALIVHQVGGLLPARIYGAFLVAVLGATVFAGPGPGVVATFLSAAVMSYYFIAPRQSFEIGAKSDYLRIQVFIGLGITIAIVAEWKRRRRLSQIESAAARARALSMDALKRSEEEYRTLFESSPDGIVRIDREGKIEQANQAFQRMLGFDLEMLIRMPLRQLMSSQSGQVEEEIAEALTLQEGDSRDYEAEFVRKDGSIFPASIVAWPIVDERSKVIGLRAFVRDVTDRKRAEEAIAEANRRKDHFIATLAHELRNPLAAIRSATFVLGRDAPGLASKREARALSIIGRQLAHLISLVDDLLEVSRITSGKIALKKVRLDLSEAIGHAVETAQPAIERGGHRFQLESPPEPLPIDADPVRLSQVFSNLLNNAAKYTEPGGVITMTVKRQGDDAVIKVADNGIGISPEALPDVFRLFAQSGRTHGHAQGGLGIGLGLVENLVKQHGGTVEAQSEGLGRGSVFTVRLPLADSSGKQAPLNQT